MLGTLEEHQKTDWKSYVPVLTHAYNATKHESTKFTPFFLMFGRHPRLPLDLAFGVTSEGKQQDVTQYTEDLKSKLETAYQSATEQACKSADRQKGHYDRKVRGAAAQVGDRVLVRNVGLRGKQKLANKWEDHIYRVKEQPSKDFPVFSVKREDGLGRTRVLHRNMILPVNYLPVAPLTIKRQKNKRAKQPEADVPRPESSSSQSEEEEEPARYNLRQRLDPRAAEFMPRPMENNVTADAEEQEEQDEEHEEEETQEEEAEEEEAQEEDAQEEQEEQEEEEQEEEEEEDSNQSTSEEEEVLARPPERELPRRSTRERRPPEWLRSGDYLVQQLQHSNSVYGQIFYV
jgi:hypothetical protein